MKFKATFIFYVWLVILAASSLVAAQSHSAFFKGESNLGNDNYYLSFPNGNYFGYYNAQNYPTIRHFDMGYEYVVDASDGRHGVYLYDYASGHYFYTSPIYSFPYLYDYTLQTILYYYPDPNNAGHYSSSPRYFYNFKTGQIISLGQGVTVLPTTPPPPPPTMPPAAPMKPTLDFDGDGKADLSVFRPSNAVWYSANSASGFSAANWGLASDNLVPADFDDDGKTDLTVWRESAADPDHSYFYILQSATNTVRVAQFGRIGDSPSFSGDWDGDGKADPTVFRDTGSGQTYFYYAPSAQPSVNFVSVPWGISGDKPVRGDFDGDGKQDAAVFRPSNGVWYILQSSNNQLKADGWGTSGDKLIPADYDGDGKTDLAVLRGTNWYIKQSSDAAFKAYNWGLSTDATVPADYDGDGKIDVAVYRGGVWYIIQSSNGQTRIDNFGNSTDIPVPKGNVQ